MALISSTIVEICIFKFEKDRPWFLLLRRSKEEKIYPGIWQFVSGSIEEGEKASFAALRELDEETAIKPSAFWVTPFVNSFYDPSWDSLNLTPLFAAQVSAGEEPKLSSEHSQWGWFLYEDALSMLPWPGQREGLRIVNEYIVKGDAAAALTRIL